MGFAFTHIAAAYLPAKLLRVRFGQWAYALLSLGAILPDIDFIAYAINPLFHRTFTHSIVFVLVVFVIARILFSRQESIALSIGVLSHVGVDMIFSPGVQVLWPAPYWISMTGGVLSTYVSSGLSMVYVIADMGLGVLCFGLLFLTGRLKL